MGFLENALGSAVPSGNLGKPLMIALAALLASGALHRQDATVAATAPTPTPGGGSDGGGLLGGLGGLLNRFQQNGQGDIINSWIGSGPNREITSNQLGSVLGPDILGTLSDKTGLSQQDLMAQLSKVLPGVVDKLTPSGRLPTEGEIAASR
jgi:uncharacterized protein YidB (DUF937 family)